MSAEARGDSWLLRHAPECSSSGCLRTHNWPFLILFKTASGLTEQSFAALPVVKWSNLLLGIWGHPDFMVSILGMNCNPSYKALYAVELVASTARLCAMNLLLHGLGNERNIDAGKGYQPSRRPTSNSGNGVTVPGLLTWRAAEDRRNRLSYYERVNAALRGEVTGERRAAWRRCSSWRSRKKARSMRVW